jgi:hypothetical protein
MTLDVDQFADVIAEAIRASTAPLARRIAILEAEIAYLRTIAQQPDGAGVERTVGNKCR